jgi:hypothetical protein
MHPGSISKLVYYNKNMEVVKMRREGIGAHVIELVRCGERFVDEYKNMYMLVTEDREARTRALCQCCQKQLYAPYLRTRVDDEYRFYHYHCTEMAYVLWENNGRQGVNKMKIIAAIREAASRTNLKELMSAKLLAEEITTPINRLLAELQEIQLDTRVRIVQDGKYYGKFARVSLLGGEVKIWDVGVILENVEPHVELFLNKIDVMMS